MIFQTPGSTLNGFEAGITGFVTAMIALSVAAERVTETIKQMLGSYLSRLKSNISAAVVQILAIFSGIFVTLLSGQNPVNVPGFQAYQWSNHHDWVSWLLSGILVSGGSAFWNHILDLLQAAKVQKEQLVNAALPDGSKIAH